VTFLCAGNPKMHPGSSITGFIDGKFDNGYLVTVNLGNHELKGVLYHIPQVMHMSQSAVPSEIATHRKRRRSRMKLRDPFRPKSNRSGYNFFFAEHYARLKPQYYGRERAISKKIGYLWNNLTEAEKQVLIIHYIYYATSLSLSFLLFSLCARLCVMQNFLKRNIIWTDHILK